MRHICSTRWLAKCYYFSCRLTFAKIIIECNKLSRESLLSRKEKKKRKKKKTVYVSILIIPKN